MQSGGRCNWVELRDLAGVGRNCQGLEQPSEMFAQGIRSFPLRLGPE